MVQVTEGKHLWQNDVIVDRSPKGKRENQFLACSSAMSELVLGCCGRPGRGQPHLSISPTSTRQWPCSKGKPCTQMAPCTGSLPAALAAPSASQLLWDQTPQVSIPCLLPAQHRSGPTHAALASSPQWAFSQGCWGVTLAQAGTGAGLFPSTAEQPHDSWGTCSCLSWASYCSTAM